MSDIAAFTGALKTRFGVTVVQQNVRPSQIRLLCRVPVEQSRNWVIFRDHMLAAGDAAAWTYDGSRVDMRHPSGSLVWGWRLIFQHEKISDFIGELTAVVSSCPRARFEVTEQALSVIGGQRSMMNAKGKGATAAGTPPLLVQQRAGGGVR